MVELDALRQERDEARAEVKRLREALAREQERIHAASCCVTETDEGPFTSHHPDCDGLRAALAGKNIAKAAEVMSYKAHRRGP